MKITNSKKLIGLHLAAEAVIDKIGFGHGWEYPNEIHDFIKEISRSDWVDYNYQSGRELKKFRSAEYMQHASEDELCSILTALSRGERFCDGFIGNAFEKGYVRNTIARLATLHDLEHR